MQDFLNYIRIASHFLIGFPADVEEMDEVDSRALPWFSVPGIVMAVITLILALACSTMLAPLAASLFTACLLVVGWGVVSRGHNLLAVPDLAKQIRRAVKPEADDDTLDFQLGQGALFLIVLLKLAAVAILVHQGHVRWLMLVPLASVLFATDMSTRLQCLPFDAPAFGPMHWLFLGVTAFVSLLFVGVLGVVALLLIWLLMHVVDGLIRVHLPTATAEVVNGGSEVAETLALVLGLILLS